MASAEQSAGEVQLRVENVGGIDETEVTLAPGITVLAGRNASNRTSLLQAIMAVLGSQSEAVSVKGDAEEGHVEARIGGTRYTRRLRRTQGGVAVDGDPFLDEPELADLFAFLLESNEARRTVARGDDLRELVVRPIDTDAIEAEIDDRVAERRRLEDRLDELDEHADRVADLEAERRTLRASLEDKREALESVRADLEAVDAPAVEAGAEQSRADDILEELQSVRSELEDVRFQLRSERDSLEALREDRADLETSLEGLADVPDEDVESLEAELDELRRRKRELTGEIGELQNVVQFNEELLSDGVEGVREVLSGDDGDVTDELVAGGTVHCWTCGSEVDREQIEATIDQLRAFLDTKYDRRRELQSRIDDASERQSTLRERRRRHEDVARRRRETTAEIERRDERVAELVDRRDDLAATVETLEEELEALQTQEYSEVLDRHREMNELEFEVERLERQLEGIEGELSTLEAALDERESLEAEREDVQSSIVDLRTRVEQIEAGAVEAFNEHMDTVLGLLDYDNLARVWIERRTGADGSGVGSQTEPSTFELHVVRRDQNGATYDDSFAHLSESEREVVGLVFALAGYLVHDVHEVVPFVLLDSLEAIDAERIQSLVEYFGEYAEYLVVALLPEDARPLRADHRSISSI